MVAGAIRLLEAPGWLIVVRDAELAARLAGELSVYLGRDVATLPARGVVYGADVAPAAHVVGERQQALLALEEGDGVVVADAVALLERFLPLDLQPRPVCPGRGDDGALRRGRARSRRAWATNASEQVRERGQFAVRGGIVDVYPSTGDPVRAEFWGDTVESLRSFSVFSQRTVAEVDRRTVYAASEVDAEDAAFQTALQQEIAAWEREGRDDAPDEAYRRGELRALARLSPRFTDLGAIAERRALRLATIQPDEVVRALAGFEGELAATVPGEEARRRTFVPLLEARRQLSDALAVEPVQREQRRRYPAARPQFAGRDVAAAERDLTRLVADGYRVFVVFRHPGEATRAAYRLKSLQARVLQDGEWRRPAQRRPPPWPAEGGDFDHASAPQPAAARPDEVLPPGLYFVSAPLREGFVSSELKLALVGERALLRAAPKGPRFAAGARLASFFDLRPGDYVVHEDHGVARFSGIETKTVAGVTRDYLFLRFKGEDKLYVPHDQIAKVTRYIGASGAAPALNRLGGNAWQAIKTRARAPWPRWPASCSTSTRRVRPSPASPSPSTAS